MGEVDQWTRDYRFINLAGLMVSKTNPLTTTPRTPPRIMIMNTVFFVHGIVTCEAVKNCSNHGACTGPNACTCEKGFHGADCSEGIKYFVIVRG